MKKIALILFCCISLSLSSKSQIVSVDAGMVSNFSPEFTFGPNLAAQYYLKNGDYCGIETLYDLSRSRESYIVRYGTDINKRFYLNTGVAFVNDWSHPQPNGRHKTYRTYSVGADYIFPKISPNNPHNFYIGCNFTDEFLYLKVGVRFFHEKTK